MKVPAGPKACRFRSHWCRPRVSCQAGGLQRTHKQGLGPDISQLKPHLQQQWDGNANHYLGNIVITPHSSRKVQWCCQECPDGHAHVWQANVQNRTNGRGCPYCAGKLVCQHNSLATHAPHLASDWDYKVNELTPANYTHYSNAKVAWKCGSCQHTWTARVKARSQQGNGCPACSRERSKNRRQYPSLAASGPAVMACWDHQSNKLAGLDPERITLCSNKLVHWVCMKCPLGRTHRWSTSPNARQFTGRHVGCPCCAGRKACKCNCLQTLYPEIAAEWDHSKNSTTPLDHTASSTMIAWWTNSKHGSWQQSIDARTRNVLHQSKYSSTDK